MKKEDCIRKFNEDDTPGWTAIETALGKIYTQEPLHFGPLCGIHYKVGGTDPVDGISVYDNAEQEAQKHLISYGMSELYYSPENVKDEFSNWGFEFTCRLKTYSEDQSEFAWLMVVFNNLSRYVYQNENWFEENQLIPANGPVRLNSEKQIHGFVTTLEPQLGKINTPKGEVSFTQIVGVTKNEIEQLKVNLSQDKIAKYIEEQKQSNPLLIIDLNQS